MSALFARSAFGQSTKTLTISNPSGLNDPQQAFITCGRHPRLRYYASEGVDVEFVNMNNSGQAMQSIATGQTSFGTLSPTVYLSTIAKNPSLDIVAVYKWLPRPIAVVIVKRDSPIKSLAELKGKRIGARNLGDPGVPLVRRAFRDLGIADSEMQYVAIGDGGVAGTALDQNRVDAMATYDTAAARVELAGFPVRYLVMPAALSDIGWSWFGVSRQSLKANRKDFVGLFRGLAKSTLFAYHNLPEAIKIHWDLYPESKPKSKSEADALEEMMTILKTRRNSWMRFERDPDQRFGASSLADWAGQAQISADALGNPQLLTELGDLSKFYTNELIDEVNDFNKETIIQQAKTFKL